jgi:cytochrome c oxidase cbb3-type subunit IV
VISAVWGQIAGVLISVMLLSFCGIWIWAWHGRHKQTFDALARLPMNEEGQPK